MLLAESFVNEVIQELVLALGLALALGNVIALVGSRRRRRRYDAELAAWEAERSRARKAAKQSKSAAKRGATAPKRADDAEHGTGPEVAVVVGPRPEEPEQARVAPAVAMILVGVGMSIWGLASLLA